jgi:deoxyribonucleoside regulator
MNNFAVERRQLLESIAQMYYIEGLSQAQIADKVSMSRANISKLLKTCVDEHIIEFKINSSTSPQAPLETMLQEKYNLKKAIVAPSESHGEINKNNVGKYAAEYLESTIKSGMLVGVAWGTTLYYVINNLKPKNTIQADVIQMVGGISPKSADTDGQNLAQKMAEALNGKCNIMQLPMLVQSKLLRDLLLEEPFVSKHFKLFDDIDIALVGLGSNRAESSAVYKSGYITREETDSILALGAIGNICGHNIDINGNPCVTNLSDKVISIELSRLRKIDTVIGAASGFEKTEAALASLRGSYIDVLIVDENLAHSILNAD